MLSLPFCSDTPGTLTLLDRVANGDVQAAAELMARCYDDVRAFVNLHWDTAIRPRLDPADIVQETLLVIARRLRDFVKRRPMPFIMWVRKTAYERLLSARRDHRAACRDIKRELKFTCHASVTRLDCALYCGRPGPREVVEAKELAERIAIALRKLSPRDREILQFRHIQEIQLGEAASLLDISPEAARQRYVRAKLRLKQLMFA